MEHQVSAVLDYMRIQNGTSSQRIPGLYEDLIWYIKSAQSWTIRIQYGTSSQRSPGLYEDLIWYIKSAQSWTL